MIVLFFLVIAVCYMFLKDMYSILANLPYGKYGVWFLTALLGIGFFWAWKVLRLFWEALLIWNH
jgi:hypothetical protein